jgi:hypothetical protein
MLKWGFLSYTRIPNSHNAIDVITHKGRKQTLWWCGELGRTLGRIRRVCFKSLFPGGIGGAVLESNLRTSVSWLSLA